MGRQLAWIGLALALVTPDLAVAKGGYTRPPQLAPFQASVAPALPRITLPAEPLIGGCGPRRYLDPHTHHCRGPGDLH